MKALFTTIVILFSFTFNFAQSINFQLAYQGNSQTTPGILEAWSYAQTRMQIINSQTQEGCSGIPLPFGIMGLFENGKDYFIENAKNISVASGYTLEEMKADPQLQINAFSKVYTDLMTQIISENGGSYKTLANIYQCIISLSEIPANSAVSIYARDLQAYEILSFLKQSTNASKYNFNMPSGSLAEVFGQDNFEILSSNKVALTSTAIVANQKNYAPNHLKSTQYGPAIWNPAPSCNFSSRSGTAVSAITIHTIQGSYAGAISWSQNCNSNVSFHYVIRSSDGQVTQMVDEANKAWHVGSENPYTIGYEHEGFVNDPVWYTNAMYNESAALSRDITLSSYGISPLRTYFGAASTGTNTLGSCVKIKGHQHYAGQSHTDPGINWNWEKYYRLINNTPTIINLTATTGNFYDTGGSSGNYADDERKIWVISPTGASAITLTFTQFSVENGYDRMFIYNGNSINAPLIGSYTNNQNPGTVTGSSGSLTVEFRSDCATVQSGWQASWQATTPTPPDLIAPTTAIVSDNTWKKENWNTNFIDADNESGVDQKFYLLGSKTAGHNGWSANQNFGFLNEDFQDNTSNWSAVNGNFLGINNTYTTNDIADANTNAWVDLNQNSGTVYLYHWNQKITSNGTNQRAGMHFFCDDATLPNRGNSYFVYFRASSNRVQIYKVVNDVYSLEKDDTCVVNTNVNYDYKVIYNPQTGKISVFSNNILVSSYIDAAPLLSGNSLSLRSGNCVVEYDNVRVYKSRGVVEQVSVGTNMEFFNQSNNQLEAGLVRSYVIDSAANWSTEAYTLHQVDWTSPQMNFFNDGSTADIDTFSSNLLEANWSLEDPHSFLSQNKIGVGTVPFSDDIIAFNDQGLVNNLSELLTNPIENQMYYISIISENQAGLIDTFSTDGQKYLENISTANLSEMASLDLIKIFPNPSVEKITLTNLHGDCIVEIYDANGKIVFTSIAQKPELEIAIGTWSKGKYTLKVGAKELSRTISFIKN